MKQNFFKKIKKPKLHATIVFDYFNAYCLFHNLISEIEKHKFKLKLHLDLQTKVEISSSTKLQLLLRFEIQQLGGKGGSGNSFVFFEYFA
jgi:hypothetical protein